MLLSFNRTTMGRKIVFNVTKMGASHLKSGKPCQDYSLSWESDNKEIQIAIVCDGHGGETYVRSDVGSKLAAEIALTNIRCFVESVSPAAFLDKSAAITARPDDDDDLFPSIKKRDKKDLTESEIQQQEQDHAFYAAVEKVREQDNLFCRLFASIYLQWKAAIRKDADENPFTEAEKVCLKNADIVKAYGSTLMAFVRTPLYWFAFHIGDGKLLCCDRNLNWSEPVPWDCNCFLNITTSLCCSNPIPMFRYAFSGEGDFPTAVIMGSDGLDDSWGTMDNLKNFYSQTLSIIHELGEEKALQELEEYLPVLSSKASRDDMSMAGIIDMEDIRTGIEIYKKRRALRILNQDKVKKETELTELKELQQKAKQEIEKLTEETESTQISFKEWLASLFQEKENKEKQIQQMKEKIELKKLEINDLDGQISAMDSEYQAWLMNAKAEKDALTAECDELLQENKTKDSETLESWHLMKQSFDQQEERRLQEKQNEKKAQMDLYNEEAMKALEECEAAQEECEVSQEECQASQEETCDETE